MSCFSNFRNNCGCGCNNTSNCFNSCNNTNRCFNSCNCSRPCGCSDPFFCPRFNSLVIRGPRGATGPQGPQGIPGTIALALGFFTSPAVQSVVANADVPLQNNVVLSGTGITHTAGQSTVTLSAGTYYINWQADATIPDSGTASLGLFVNGVADQNSQSSVTGTANTTARLSGSTMLVVTTPTTIALRNTGTATTSYQNVSMSVIKLA